MSSSQHHRPSENRTFPVTAPPPLHSVILVINVLILCLASVPSVLSSMNDVAKIETFSTPIFDFMPTAALGWIRIGFAAFIFLVTIMKARHRTNPFHITNYLKQSKLRPLPIRLAGFGTLVMFTSWAWNLLGISFLLNGTITLLANTEYGKLLETEYKWVLKVALLLFETAAPTSMLVSAVVRYAIWPQALIGHGSQALKYRTTLAQHNANIIMSLLEVGLLGGLPIRPRDVAVAPLFGICYIFFSWNMRLRWVKSREPQFLYFFLDTTLGKTTSYAILGLVVILSISFGLFSNVGVLMAFLGGGVLAHCLVIVTVASLVCRYRD